MCLSRKLLSSIGQYGIGFIALDPRAAHSIKNRITRQVDWVYTGVDNVLRRLFGADNIGCRTVQGGECALVQFGHSVSQDRVGEAMTAQQKSIGETLCRDVETHCAVERSAEIGRRI